MEDYTLQVEKRPVPATSPTSLRTAGYVPAVIYGGS